ncbi:MAG: response regulator [Thermotogota bacterium]
MKILIADDSILMRRNLKSILKQLGYNVIAEATNGQEAVDLYKKLKPDVVTMDISMPVMDGIEAVNQIVQLYPDANIIMISALNQKEMVFKAIERGAKYYIIKPFKIDMVAKALEQVFESKRKTPQALTEIAPFQSTENASGYVVSNKNGVFIIKLYSALNNKQSIELKGTIQGLLAIPNVKITFDLKSCAFADQVIPKLQPYTDTIKLSGGIFDIVK